MQNNNYLSRDKTQALIDELGVTKDEGQSFLKGLADKGYTIEGYNDQKPEQSFTERVGQDVQNRVTKLGESLTSLAKPPTATDAALAPITGMANPIDRVKSRILGQLAGVVGDTQLEAIKSIFDTADQATGQYVSSGAKSIGQGIMESPVGPAIAGAANLVGSAYNTAQTYAPQTTQDVADKFNMASVAPSAKTSQIVGGLTANTAVPVAKAGLKAIKQTPEVVSTVSKSIQDIGKTPKTLEQAVGQIAQGTTEAIRPVQTALQVVDTSKVKTYSDLLGQINKKVPELAGVVDNELAKDATLYKLGDLALKQTTKTGRELSTDYVSKGLNELKDFYTATGNEIAKADIEDLIAKANLEGLTRKEVNDIARLHGRELNAYNANGQLASGITKQAVENTRQGLKDIARQGIGGEEARLADQQLSALYDTQQLIEKNVEAVNKLQQKINERGLVEKIGYNFAKYADILTGGTLRGVVGGILPRGAGYKTMNALDIEDALRGNLDIVEKALKSKNDKELIDTLYQLKSSVDKSARSASSLNKNTTATTNTITNKTNISTDIPQSTKKASGKLGGFAQFLRETPDGKLKGKMVPEDADAVVDFADVVENPNSVSDKMYLKMRKEIKGIAKAYNVKGKTDRELVDALLKKIYNDYHKFPGFSELGLLPKLAIGTALTAGAIKAGVELNKK